MIVLKILAPFSFFNYFMIFLKHYLPYYKNFHILLNRSDYAGNSSLLLRFGSNVLKY